MNLIQENNKESALSLLSRSYDKLNYKGIYEGFDYAEFLKNNEQFEQAFDFYQRRLDKGYRLTDCASMEIMRQLEILEILTFDKHFQQEGFRALLRE